MRAEAKVVASSTEEIYLGGIASGDLKKGLGRGYGIYVTSKRIIGLKKRKLGFLGAITTGVVSSAVGGVTSVEESRKAIEELDKERKDIEIPREEVAYIELKKPTFFKRGHLLIRMASGEEIKIMILGKKAFEPLKGLMKAFKPEVLKVEE